MLFWLLLAEGSICGNKGLTNDHGATVTFPFTILLPPEIPPKRFEMRPKTQ